MNPAEPEVHEDPNLELMREEVYYSQERERERRGGNESFIDANN